jgi:hypothetical protein
LSNTGSNVDSTMPSAERDSADGVMVNKEVPRYSSTQLSLPENNNTHTRRLDSALDKVIDEEKTRSYKDDMQPSHEPQRWDLTTWLASKYRWLQETFPTVMAVLSHLPLKLVPFALAMFVLIQGLVTKGWVPVFAYGWDHWVTKTGTIGAIGGMGFLGVILCNVRIPSCLTKLKDT